MNQSVRLKGISEVREAKDGRQFYLATFQDPSNPFGKTVTRTFWQQKDSAGQPVWKGANPEEVKPFVGKLIPGYIKTAKVEAYEVTGSNGAVNMATTYTTVILGAELDEQVFKSLNHPLATTAAVEAPVAQEAELEIG